MHKGRSQLKSASSVIPVRSSPSRFSILPVWQLHHVWRKLDALLCGILANDSEKLLLSVLGNHWQAFNDDCACEAVERIEGSSHASIGQLLVVRKVVGVAQGKISDQHNSQEARAVRRYSRILLIHCISAEESRLSAIAPHPPSNSSVMDALLFNIAVIDLAVEVVVGIVAV